MSDMNSYLFSSIRSMLIRIATDLSGMHLASRLTDAQKKYGKLLTSDDIARLSKGDTSGNHKYLDWMCQRAIEDGVDEVIKAVKLFTDYPSLFKVKEIRSYDSSSDLVETFEKAIKERKEDISVLEGSHVLYPKDGDLSQFLILTIPDHEAAKRYGNGTRWCISANLPSAFEDYVRQGCVFYMLYDLLDDEKYAVQVHGEALQDFSNEIIPVSVWEPSDTTLPHGLLREIVKDEFYPIFRLISKDAPSRVKSDAYITKDLSSGLDDLEAEEKQDFPDLKPEELLYKLNAASSQEDIKKNKILLNRAPASLLQSMWSFKNKIRPTFRKDYLFRLPRSFINSHLDDLNLGDVKALAKKLPTKYLRKRVADATGDIIREVKRRLPADQFLSYIYDCFRAGNETTYLLSYMEECGLVKTPKEIPVDVRYRLLSINMDDRIFADTYELEKSLKEDDPDFVDFQYFYDTNGDADDLAKIFGGEGVPSRVYNIGTPKFEGSPKEACDHLINLMQTKYSAFPKKLSWGAHQFLRIYSGRPPLELREIITNYSKKRISSDIIPLIINQGLEKFTGKEALVMMYHGLKNIRNVTEKDVEAFYRTIFFYDDGTFKENPMIPNDYFNMITPVRLWEKIFSGENAKNLNNDQLRPFIVGSTLGDQKEMENVLKLYNFRPEVEHQITNYFFNHLKNPHGFFKFVVNAYESIGWAPNGSWSEWSLPDGFFTSRGYDATKKLIREYQDRIPLFSSRTFAWANRP